MSQKLFELIERMTGHLCTQDDLDEIIRTVKEADRHESWIKVSEQLPQHENNVFAVLYGLVRVMAYCSYKEDGQIKYAWHYVYGGINGDPIFDDNYYPTHWMDIPKPPKI